MTKKKIRDITLWDIDVYCRKVHYCESCPLGCNGRSLECAIDYINLDEEMEVITDDR